MSENGESRTSLDFNAWLRRRAFDRRRQGLAIAAELGLDDNGETPPPTYPTLTASRPQRAAELEARLAGVPETDTQED